MQEVTIKQESSVKLEPEIKEFLNPRFVFLPIRKGFKLKVTDNAYVYKNDIVAMKSDGKIIYSSISGRVLGIKEMLIFDNTTSPCIVIENDFKENMRSRKSARKYINDYNREEFMRILDDTSLYYKGAYLVEKLNFKDNPIIVNAVDLEPYFANRHFTLKDNVENILETIDLIGSFNEPKRIVLVVKNTESEIINEIMNLIGTYPNIELKLVSDAYPNGMPEILKKILSLDDAITFDIEEIDKIYDVLRREIPVTETLLTITGNAVKPKAVCKVKIGSLLSEVFVNNFDFTEEAVDVYLNGMMHGTIVNTLKYVVDSNIDGILIMKKSKKILEACMNCGMCSKNCPMGLNPKYVFDHEGKVKSEYYVGCIQCGLCNYSCPANRDLISVMRGRDEP